MQAEEIIIALASFGLAVWYLYRKFVVTKGCSCGKSECHSGVNGKFPSADQRNDNNTPGKL